jgi:hypothetical protein
VAALFGLGLTSMGGMKTQGKPGLGPSSQLSRLGKVPGKANNGRETTCSNCLLGIYEQEPRMWQRGQRMGLVHVECDNPNGDGK